MVLPYLVDMSGKWIQKAITTGLGHNNAVIIMRFEQSGFVVLGITWDVTTSVCDCTPKSLRFCCFSKKCPQDVTRKKAGINPEYPQTSSLEEHIAKGQEEKGR